jgi:hypothetical protein
MNMARPPTFETPEQFKSAADGYFAQCFADEKVPTVNGLALALGFNSRQSLLNYAEKPEFLDVVKAVRTRLEAEWEQRLAGGSAAGTIFWLKNQGWTDKSEQVVSATVEHTGSVTLDPSEAYLRMLNG